MYTSKPFGVNTFFGHKCIFTHLSLLTLRLLHWPINGGPPCIRSSGSILALLGAITSRSFIFVFPSTPTINSYFTLAFNGKQTRPSSLVAGLLLLGSLAGPGQTESIACAGHIFIQSSSRVTFLIRSSCLDTSISANHETVWLVTHYPE